MRLLWKYSTEAVELRYRCVGSPLKGAVPSGVLAPRPGAQRAAGGTPAPLPPPPKRYLAASAPAAASRTVLVTDIAGLPEGTILYKAFKVGGGWQCLLSHLWACVRGRSHAHAICLLHLALQPIFVFVRPSPDGGPRPGARRS